jgi:glutamyl-tRNA reductase
VSILVVGLSHVSAPVATLERAVVSGDGQVKLLRDVHSSEHVAGSMVLSTCNRIEVYAEVDRFHGGVAAIGELIARHAGLPVAELSGSAYVHYADRAAAHLLAVACGLESMVIGESQILGQVKEAVRLARQYGTLSRELSDLGRLALRAGRRAHAETGIDAAGQNLVTLGLDLAAAATQRPGRPADEAGGGPLSGFSVLVVGAGSMSSLAVATATRQGADRVVVANRTPGRAERLAEKYGATAVGLTELPAAIAVADLVITCTGASRPVVTESLVSGALGLRGAADGPLVLLDLALPRDVEAGVGDLPGVRLIDLETMGEGGQGAASRPAGHPGLASETDKNAVRQIVAQELDAYLQADLAASVAPTVVALRAKAATVVDAELTRLERRLGDLDPRVRREIAQSMGRIADKLLHGPTVRVKELAGSPGADSYEDALRVLFELDPDAVQAVARPDAGLLAWPDIAGAGKNSAGNHGDPGGDLP